MKLVGLFLMLIFAASAPYGGLAAQSPERIEVLGLRNWTVQMLESAVSRYAPGMTLADAACAVVLRDSIGFPDATTFTLTDVAGTRWRVLIVIEPESSAFVRFVPTSGEFPEVQEWSDIFSAMGPDFQLVSQVTGELLVTNADSLGRRPIPDSLITVRETVRRHASERDWELARHTLLNDSNWRNRAVASLILSNFAERDSTLYLLAEGLRWPHGTASETSYSVLSALVRDREAAVDWSPARDALTALLGGTGLGMLPKVMTLLIDSGIEQSLGSELARVNPELLLDYLRADNPLTPIAVHNFLQHVSGFEAMRTSAVWEDFLFQISGLEHQQTL